MNADCALGALPGGTSARASAHHLYRPFRKRGTASRASFFSSFHFGREREKRLFRKGGELYRNGTLSRGLRGTGDEPSISSPPLWKKGKPFYRPEGERGKKAKRPGRSQGSAREKGKAGPVNRKSGKGKKRGGGKKNPSPSSSSHSPKLRPRVGREHPLDLSISLSGGKETNRDPLSNGERSGESSGLESGGPRAFPNCGLEGRRRRAGARGPSPLERGAGEGESPVRDLGGTAPVRPRRAPGESGCLGMQP